MSFPPILPPHVAARSRALRIAAAIAVAAALLSTGAGWMLRGLTSPAPPVAPVAAERVALAGPASVAVPGDWLPVAAVPGVKGLDPIATATFQPVAALDAYAIITFTTAQDPSLIPAGLRPLLPARLPKPASASLGGAHAWRYGELPAPGDRTLELTVAPTSAGVLAVACVASREAWVAALGCASQLRSVSLENATWLRPGPEVAVRALIPGAVQRLNTRRSAIRAKLRTARSPRAQKRLANRLASAYADTAKRLAPSTPRAGAPASVIAALRGAANANRRMGVAAGHRWPKRYRLARHAVKRHDRAITRALKAL